jgi:sterol 24-C-methyltransferase
MRRFVEEHPVLVGLGASAAVGLVLVVRRRSTRTGTEVDLSKEHLSESGKTYMDNLVTDWYKWWWGQSFHFGPRFRGESLEASITRAEFHLANRLHMKQGMKVLDVGCGVGGPMRNMAMFTGSTVTGITLDEYQATLGNKQNETVGQVRTPL